MEIDRQRSRFKDEVTLMGAENEDLLAKNEELKNELVSNSILIKNTLVYFILSSVEKKSLIFFAMNIFLDI